MSIFRLYGGTGMSSDRKLLTVLTFVFVAAPITSLLVRLYMGWSLLPPLYLALSLLPPLLLIWTWHWFDLPGRPFLESAGYVLFVAAANRLLAVDVMGAFYIIPFLGVVNRDRRIIAFAAALSAAAVWLLVLERPDDGLMLPDLIAHTFLILACSLLFAQVTAILQRQEKELVAAETRLTEQMARQWAITVEARSPYTAGHVQRVTQYALLIAPHVKEMQMDLQTFGLACILHDVGKIAVPDSVLNKPGSLTADEYAVIKSHTVRGYEMVLRTGATPEVAAVVRSHHERWNGSGYPDGLRGEQIPVTARVLAVADTFDAMTSHRSYRPAIPPDHACAEIVRLSGHHYDPQVVEAFQEVYARVLEVHGDRAHSA
jgi:putative nucleotidyltransferase with HDIG domain